MVTRTSGPAKMRPRPFPAGAAFHPSDVALPWRLFALVPLQRDYSQVNVVFAHLGKTEPEGRAATRPVPQLSQRANPAGARELQFPSPLGCPRLPRILPSLRHQNCRLVRVVAPKQEERRAGHAVTQP